jgi:ATP-dependent exoDNAse (exonuclease V) alpha subunit
MLTLTPEFTGILDELEKDKNHLVITGKAGTGKSTLLNLFRTTTKLNAVFLAPTGIAALRIKGQTIHSFFRFPPRLITPMDIQRHFLVGRLVKKLQVLVIDEMSMLRADVLDAIDASLKLHRRNDHPFGGVKLVLFGDMYQLPPVVGGTEEAYLFNQKYASPYFFDSDVWGKLTGIQYIQLNQVFRQKDAAFIHLLDQIRNNELEAEDLAVLNNLVDLESRPGNGYIYLSPRNHTVDRINKIELDQIDKPVEVFQGELTGDFSLSNVPANLVLSLKIGSQVMIIRNDVDMAYVNGTIGVITNIGEKIEVTDSITSEVYKIEKAKWEMIRYIIDPEDKDKISTKTIGTFEQYPLKLAWAMTIHKSQGQTFDRVILDMEGGAFEHGQTYVALSRCTGLEGLKLKRPLRSRDFILDERIFAFLHNFR